MFYVQTNHKVHRSEVNFFPSSSPITPKYTLLCYNTCIEYLYSVLEESIEPYQQIAQHCYNDEKPTGIIEYLSEMLQGRRTVQYRTLV